MVTVLYFARLRETLGKASEQFALPHGVGDVASLRRVLESRGGAWAQELSACRNVRMAVNQDIASAETPIKDGDEVAFFPPVTGG
jgi:molybdopterin synthase sulfur carrier subunit